MYCYLLILQEPYPINCENNIPSANPMLIIDQNSEECDHSMKNKLGVDFQFTNVICDNVGYVIG